ncbi:hypothetical protein ACVWYO_002051 [Sphingomonas sp. UYP23]
MPSNVSATRAPSKPRMRSWPPDAPYGSLLVKLTPGIWLIVSRIDWPGTRCAMNSCVSTAFGLGVSGISMPLMLGLARVPLTMMSVSASIDPVDWAAAKVGKPKPATAAPYMKALRIVFLLKLPNGDKIVRHGGLLKA